MIGQTIWLFDENRRRYPKDANGQYIPGAGPIWRGHWAPYEVVGETSRSWVVIGGRKVPKKGGRGIAFAIEDIDRHEWVHEHRYRIASKVQYCDDYDALRIVAAAVGYQA